MTQEAYGNNNVQITDIYALVDSIFNNKFTMTAADKNAADLLYLAKGINIPNNIFTQVKLGNELNVLIYDGYLGKDNIDYVYDFAMVNNKPTLYIFSDTLTNDKIPPKLRAERIYRLFSALVSMYSKQDYMILMYSIYHIMCYYTPIVLMVRLIESYYNREFKLDHDFDRKLFPDSIGEWFNQEALDIIHSMNDRQLFEFGGLVEHVENNCNIDF